MNCLRCGVDFTPKAGPGRPRKFCDSVCTAASQVDRRRGAAECGVCAAPIWLGQKLCRPCLNRKNVAEETARLVGTVRACRQCEAEFTPVRDVQAYCSARCQNRYKHLHRAGRTPEKYRGEFISLAEVFRRDGGVCQLCFRPVDLTVRYPDPESAALDHVVPVSKGGPHTFTNVQIAHMECNSRKREGRECDETIATAGSGSP